ncbi:MAG: hypothetical protein U9R25_09850 [Chloroflexota bacterium]|nr:hypothetical protein [Chloroflexota bacterium]
MASNSVELRSVFWTAAIPEGPVSLFSWSILGPSVQRALESHRAQGGFELSGPPLWQRQEGSVQVNEDALSDIQRDAPAVSQTTASLGQRLLGRGPTVDPGVASSEAAFESIHRWAQNVRSMAWQQATILQVMEEIEPRAQLALETWFRVSDKLVIVRDQSADMLGKWLPQEAQPLLAGFDQGLDSGLGEMHYRYALQQLQQAAAENALTDEMGARFLRSFGHWAPLPLESASPRWRQFGDQLGSEVIKAAARDPGDLLDPSAARQTRASAANEAKDRLGRLRRRQFEPLFQALQVLVEQLSASREALVTVMDASRTWALAAAREGIADGRLLAEEEVFLLELEELKQMMTGEWSNPAQVHPLVQSRKGERWSKDQGCVVLPANARASSIQLR